MTDFAARCDIHGSGWMMTSATFCENDVGTGSLLHITLIHHWPVAAATRVDCPPPVHFARRVAQGLIRVHFLPQGRPAMILFPDLHNRLHPRLIPSFLSSNHLRRPATYSNPFQFKIPTVIITLSLLPPQLTLNFAALAATVGLLLPSTPCLTMPKMDYWFNESKTDFCFQNRFSPSRTFSMRRKQGPPAGAVAAAGGLVEKKSKNSKKEPFSPVGENPRRARLREIRFCGAKQTSQPRESLRVDNLLFGHHLIENAATLDACHPYA